MLLPGRWMMIPVDGPEQSEGASAVSPDYRYLAEADRELAQRARAQAQEARERGEIEDAERMERVAAAAEERADRFARLAEDAEYPRAGKFPPAGYARNDPLLASVAPLSTIWAMRGCGGRETPFSACRHLPRSSVERAGISEIVQLCTCTGG